jgi:hypothetical protein
MKTWKGLEVKFLKANIFERRTFFLVSKKKVISTLDLTTYQTVGALTFLLAGNESFIH